MCLCIYVDMLREGGRQQGCGGVGTQPNKSVALHDSCLSLFLFLFSTCHVLRILHMFYGKSKRSNEGLTSLIKSMLNYFLGPHVQPGPNLVYIL